MTGHKLTSPPVAMGLMLGLMLPFLLHSERGLGLGFVLAHLAVALTAMALGLCLPRPRPLARRFLTHHPKPAHLPLMGFGLALGWGAVCLYCLAILGEHH
ncbi:hypothetical protein [Dinoroseobacter sp. S124A]|uniref:hypothetical protein n=1 Tax=Dinoroseobacter sp. S124A TaxID=3415128 RepID=UPI003C7DAB87